MFRRAVAGFGKSRQLKVKPGESQLGMAMPSNARQLKAELGVIRCSKPWRSKATQSESMSDLV